MAGPWPEYTAPGSCKAQPGVRSPPPLDTIRLCDNNPCHLPAMGAGLEVANAKCKTRNGLP